VKNEINEKKGATPPQSCTQKIKYHGKSTKGYLQKQKSPTEVGLFNKFRPFRF